MIRMFAVAMLGASLLIGCGPEVTDNVEQDNPDEQDQSDEEDDDNGTWTEVEYADGGWMELDAGLVDDLAEFDDFDGTWIEDGHQAAPDSCDGNLGAEEDSDGLAAFRIVAEPGPAGEDNQDEQDDFNDGSDPSDNDQDQEEADEDEHLPGELTVRPDLEDQPAPIYRTRFDGWVRDFDEEEAFERLLEVDDRGVDDALTINVCGTLFERGRCYLPTEDFDELGCGATANSSPRPFDVFPEIGGMPEAVEEDGEWHLYFSVSGPCEHTNSTESGHDSELTPGFHRVRLHDPEVLEEGGTVELTDDDFGWEASYEVSRSGPLENPGGYNCTWDMADIDESQRASVRLEDDEVFVDLRGGGEHDEFWLWGGLEVPDGED